MKKIYLVDITLIIPMLINHSRGTDQTIQALIADLGPAGYIEMLLGGLASKEIGDAYVHSCLELFGLSDDVTTLKVNQQYAVIEDLMTRYTPYGREGVKVLKTNIAVLKIDKPISCIISMEVELDEGKGRIDIHGRYQSNRPDIT